MLWCSSIAFDFNHALYFPFSTACLKLSYCNEYIDRNYQESSQTRCRMANINPSTFLHRKNWQIHLLYVRQEFDQCLEIIEEQITASKCLCEYPIFVKGNKMCGNKMIIQNTKNAIVGVVALICFHVSS